MKNFYIKLSFLTLPRDCCKLKLIVWHFDLSSWLSSSFTLSNFYQPLCSRIVYFPMRPYVTISHHILQEILGEVWCWTNRTKKWRSLSNENLSWMVLIMQRFSFYVTLTRLWSFDVVVNLCRIAKINFLQSLMFKLYVLAWFSLMQNIAMCEQTSCQCWCWYRFVHTIYS